MDNKELALPVSLLTYLPFSAAQVTEANSANLVQLLESLLGIQFTNPAPVIGLIASLGVMWGATYVVLKTGMKKLGLDDHVLPDSRGRGHNILIVISLLVVLSMLGTGAFMGVMRGWQAIVGLTFTLGLFGLLAYLLVGGTTLFAGGLSKTTGRGAQALAEGVETGSEAFRKAGELLSSSEEEAQEAEREIEEAEERAESGDTDTADAEAEDAAEELEDAIQRAEQVEEIVESLMEKDHSQIQQTMEELRESMRLSEDEQERIENLKKFDDRIVNGIQNLGGDVRAFVNEQGRPPRPEQFLQNSENDFRQGFQTLLSDASNMAQLAQELVEEAKQERRLEQEEVQELLQEVQSFVEAHELVHEMIEEEGVLVESDEELKQLAKALGDRGLAEEAETEEQQEEQMYQNLQYLVREEEQIEEDLNQAEQALGQIIKFNQQEVEELRAEISEDGRVREELQNLEDYYQTVFQESFGKDLPGDVQEAFRDMRGTLEALDNQLQQLSRLKQQEEEDLEQVIQKIDNAIQRVEQEDDEGRLRSLFG